MIDPPNRQTKWASPGAPRPEWAYAPRMTWQDIEVVIEDLAPTPDRKAAALVLFQELKAASVHLSPMDLLQQIILHAAMLMDVNPTPTRPAPPPSLPADPLPRWHFDELETAIHYSSKGEAQERTAALYRSLLNRQEDVRTGIEAMRELFLIAFGMRPQRSSSSARSSRRTPVPPPRSRASSPSHGQA